MTQRTSTPAHPVTAVRSATVTAWLTLMALSAIALQRLRGEQPVDDRGSDSTEKAYMIILSCTIGATVLAAAGALIATKTALFK